MKSLGTNLITEVIITFLVEAVRLNYVKLFRFNMCLEALTKCLVAENVTK